MSTPEIPKPKNLLERISLGSPELEAARAKAINVLEQARLNEAVRVVTALEDEVRTMRISDRFNERKKPSESGFAIEMNLNLVGLGEKEHKRAVLLLTLQNLKAELTTAVGKLEGIVMDIEATKVD